MRERYYALSGKMGSGKTTIAEGLVALYGFRKRALADAIKEMVATAIHCPLNFVYKEKVAFRQALQGMGQAARYYYGDEYWTLKLLEHVESAEADVPNDECGGVMFVVDDLRFRHEAILLQEFGFKLVRIEDDPYPHERWCREQGYTKADMEDVSETALDSWDEWDIMISGRPAPISDVFASFLACTGLARDIDWGRHYAAKALGHGD